MFFNEEFETLPREAIEALQLKRLKAMVAHVEKSVPFYRESLAKAGVTSDSIETLADLARLPFTYKQDMRDSYPYRMFAVPMEDIVRIHASSGTTGKPTVVGYTRKDIDTWSELMARSFVAAGVHKGDIIHNSYGYGLFTGGLGAHYGAERLGASVIPMSGGNTKKRTAQEAWTRRNGHQLYIPAFLSELIEQIAFVAREDKRIDKRSGVSQRLPISVIENVVSNAERRAIREASEFVVPRVADVYAALPSITGKLELEYEGEMKGADTVAREIIRTAIAKTFDKHFGNGDMKQVVQWFELGGEIRLDDTESNTDVLQGLRNIQGLIEKTASLKLPDADRPEVQISAAEFILEGLHAHKRIGRSEERVFTAGEKAPKRASEREMHRDDLDEDIDFRRKNRRPFN